MELYISRALTIRELNKEFQKGFPYLKFELYRVKHKPGESSQLEQQVAENIRLSEISESIRSSFVELQPSDTVAKAEMKLQDMFGLPVQVCRRTGDLWVETTQTDNLTLESQNNIGKASSQSRMVNIHTLLLL